VRVLVDPQTGEVYEALDADLVGGEPYDYAGARRAVMSATRERRQAERDFRAAVKEKGEAQAEYRRLKARATLEAKKEHGSTIAETLAQGTEPVAAAYERRIIAEGLEKAAGERLRLCSEDRASLHRLIEWSRESDPDGWRNAGGRA
jgi:hypothetical protein